MLCLVTEKEMFAMDSKVRGGLLVGAGFLLGTLGVKALTSKQARACYVKGVACGLKAKEGYERIVEEAKSQVDDIVAEASYISCTSSEDKGAKEAAGESAEKAADATA